MKSRWERYCELRRIDNWCLRNPRKVNLVAVAIAGVIFGVSQVLLLLAPAVLLALSFVAFSWLVWTLATNE